MKNLMTLAVALSVLGFSTAALADEAPAAGGGATTASADSSGGGIRAAALVGMGFGSDPNIYGLGFGARAGLNVSQFYVGGTFIYHLGKSETVGNMKTSVGVMYYGVEAGYPIPMGGINVMPYLGLGQAKAHAEVCISSVCGAAESTAEIYASPGVAITTTGKIFFGADVRYTRVLTGEGDKGKASAPGVFGTVGMSF